MDSCESSTVTVKGTPSEITPPVKKIRTKSDAQMIIEIVLFGKGHNKEIKYGEPKDGKGHIIFYDGKAEILLKKKGSGANGTVMEAIFLEEDRKFAIKIGDKNKILREHNCISYLNKDNSSKNVIKTLFQYVEYNNLGALVLPSYDTDLEWVISFKKSLSNSDIEGILRDILTGLAYTHNLCVIHGDLKPENILVNKDNLECTLADFGLAQQNRRHPLAGHQLARHIVSRWYRAPEIIKEEKYSFPVDIWSFGCILYELITEKVCFKGNACGNLSPSNNTNIPLDIKGGMMDLINNNQANKDLALICRMKNYKIELVDLFMQCIDIDPSKRITAKDALNHKFFTG